MKLVVRLMSATAAGKNGGATPYITRCHAKARTIPEGSTMAPTEKPGRTPRQPMATPDEVAEYLRVETDTLRSWRRRGVGPAWTYVGGLCRYFWADVDAHVEAERKVPGGASVGPR